MSHNHLTNTNLRHGDEVPRVLPQQCWDVSSRKLSLPKVVVTKLSARVVRIFPLVHLSLDNYS